MFGLDVVIDIDIHSHFLSKKTTLKPKNITMLWRRTGPYYDIDIHYHLQSKNFIHN